MRGRKPTLVRGERVRVRVKVEVRVRVRRRRLPRCPREGGSPQWFECVCVRVRVSVCACVGVRG